MTRYDPDMHALEPVSTWPAEWVDRWPEKVEKPLDDYLRALDASGCDAGLFLPTRGLFMDLDEEMYNDWASEFCESSGGRLRHVHWKITPDVRYSEMYVARPDIALGLIANGQEKPLIVHSCTTLRYSQNFHVDHATTHPVDAMRFLAELAALPEPPQCNIFIAECGTWWLDGWLKHLAADGLTPPMDRIWLGQDAQDVAANDGGGNPQGYERSLLGSDTGHYDSMDLSLVSTRQREQAWTEAERFMGGTVVSLVTDCGPDKFPRLATASQGG